jgi:ribosome biogenesis GTPase A
VDVVIEVRDARIPLATTHPQVRASLRARRRHAQPSLHGGQCGAMWACVCVQIPEWIKGRQHVVVLNREDCVRAEERRQWQDWYVALLPLYYVAGLCG